MILLKIKISGCRYFSCSKVSCSKVNFTIIYYSKFSSGYLYKQRRGGLVVTLWPIKLATRVRFPVGADRLKSVRVSDVVFHLPYVLSHARYGDIQKGLLETGKLSVFVLFPVISHD